MQARLIDLEIRYSHLEHLLNELNNVVFAQQRQLESLTQQLSALRERLGGLESPVRDEPPPHY